jgi:hypothetical protein
MFKKDISKLIREPPDEGVALQILLIGFVHPA